MKTVKSILVILFFVLGLCHAQVPVELINNYPGVKFVSDEKWIIENGSDSDGLVFVNRNQNIQVHVWHVKSSGNVNKCLDAIVMEAGLLKLGEPFKQNIGNKTATAIITGCVKKHRPYRELIMAVKNSDGYDIISATCPEDCFRDHCEQLKRIIMSFKYFEPDDSYAYFHYRLSEWLL
ncbi:MAG TPA: hypothetical protein VJ951_06690 [Bacteroidales bacterium]|nr:hypothetical protein [Bacteroidales bacterium]